jgi:DNA repair protein RadD
MNLPELRSYQTDVTDRAAAHARQGKRRGIIQGECGCGKTFIAAYLARRAYQKGSRVLILAARRRLVGQLSGTLDLFAIRHGMIMAGRTGATREPVICASRDTFAGWVGNNLELPPFDLILVDEAHGTPTSVYEAVLARYPGAYVIGLTATPARTDGKSLGGFYQWLECTVPASQLVGEGYLIKPEVYAPLELAKRRGKGGEVKGLAGDPVAHWRDYADGLPTIAFCSKVTESVDLVNRFTAAGVRAEHIDADTPDDALWDGKSLRDRAYDRLAKGETQVLSSVGLLIEGVDIPEAAAVILWSRFGSMVKFRQATGRIMRPAPGKTRGVVLDHAGAAGQHGLPGEDVDWSLDIGSTVDERRKAAVERDPEKATVYCQACGTAYSGKPNCPNCGKAAPRPPRKRKPMAEEYTASRDEILVRFEGDDQRQALAGLFQKQWRKAIYTAIARNGTAGMAAHVFRTATGKSPWEARVEPLAGDWKAPAADVWPQFVRVKA